MSFNLEQTAIFSAVRWGKCPAFRLANPLKKLFLVLFILAFLLFLYGFLPQNFSDRSCQILLGLSIICLTFSLGSWLKDSFFNLKLKRPYIKQAKLLEQAASDPERYNLAELLSFEVAEAVFESLKFAKRKKISEVNSSILFYFLLAGNPKLNFVFVRALLNLNSIKKAFQAYFETLGKTSDRVLAKGERIYSKDFQDSIAESLKTAQKRNHQRIEAGDVIIALAKQDLIFKKILIDAKLKPQGIENLVYLLESLEKRVGAGKRFWEYKNLIKRGSLAKQWATGYTIVLDQYSTDWTEVVKRRGFPEIVGHQKELEAVERVLTRPKINNVLLVGRPGSGRELILQALAVKSALGESSPSVNYKRVVEIDLPTILSQFTGEEAGAVLDKIFQEVVSAGNVILVINNFHNFVGGQKGPGVVDISGVLSSYLKFAQFPILAITTFAGLHKYIELKPAILSFFSKVEVAELSKEETLLALEDLALILEIKYKRFLSYPALRDIVDFSDKYFPAAPLSKKAADLLNEIMVYVSATKDKIVLPRHVAKIVSEKTEIPVGEVETKEREVLLNLENLIHQRIINQDRAVREVAAALRRARAEVTIRKGPMGSFLFLGPTGVGKTETAKALTETYFGSEKRIIRMDMSEFQAVSDIPRLIGSPGQEGLLTTRVREKPFSLILLDEIEKAHPNILNLFLQVLDEGFLTDGLGRKVSFKNSIIIVTSNAGYKIILQALREKTEWQKVKNVLLDYLFEKAIFRPEFINRFDGVIIFRPLTKENLLEIAELLLQKLKKNLKQKGIELIITLPLKEKIVDLGYNPTFGAREMRRVIQDKVENVLASALLSEKLKRGDKIEVDPEEFKLIIK